MHHCSSLCWPELLRRVLDHRHQMVLPRWRSSRPHNVKIGPLASPCRGEARVRGITSVQIEHVLLDTGLHNIAGLWAPVEPAE
jgi:hypothetical protein